MSAMMIDPKDEEFSEEETARRRDAALFRALSTPHKRQADMKVGKPKANPVAAPDRARKGPPRKSEQ